MLIKQLNKIAVARVIKNDDVKKILDADEYVETVKATIEDELHAARQQVIQIKQEALQTTTKEVLETNAKVLAEFEQSLDLLLKEVGNRLHDIVYRTLHKCGIDEIDYKNLKNLITLELRQITTPNDITISANSEVLEILQREFTEESDKISWVVKPDLPMWQCECSTNLWVMHLDIAAVKQQIQRILKMP